MSKHSRRVLYGCGDGSKDMAFSLYTGSNIVQKVPTDYQDQLHDFRKTIITIRKAKHIQPSHIVSMDLTMCRFNMPPSHTNSKKGCSDKNHLS